MMENDLKLSQMIKKISHKKKLLAMIVEEKNF